jgi:hypothetical protein
MRHILTQEDKSNFYREQTGEDLLGGNITLPNPIKFFF